MKSVTWSYMLWPVLDKEIENLAKSCSACQVLKQAPPVAPLHPWVWPSKPWQWVHYDFAGPFQGAMFLHAVDPFSKCPEVQVISTTNIPATCTLGVWRECYCTLCFPQQIVVDNGSQFTAEAFKAFTQYNEIQNIRARSILQWVGEAICPIPESESESILE